MTCHGVVSIPLNYKLVSQLFFQDIPSAGHQRWYKLEGRSARSSVEGEIKLRLALATREDRGIPEDDNWTDVRQHEDLMCLFIEHEVRKYKVSDA